MSSENKVVTVTEPKTFDIVIKNANYDTKRPRPTTIQVPSRGHLYGGKFPSGELIISAMTTMEEQLLQSKSSDKVNILNELCERCILKMPVSFNELLLPDMFYILLCIRNISYGPVYTFNLTCPECSQKFRKDVTVPNDLEVTGLSEEDDCEPYEIFLPMSQKKVKFSLLRIKNENDIRRFTKNAYSKSVVKGDPSYSYRIASYIQSIDDKEMNPIDKLEFVQNLISGDTNVLRNAIEKREFGANLRIDCDCPACGDSSKTMMPFDSEFFRPSNT